MPTLLVVRHGKSKWNEEGVADHDRSLAKRGRIESRRLGEELAQRDLVPDVILSSTAKRARSTAKQILKGSGHDEEPDLLPELYSGGPVEVLMALRGLPDAAQVAMIVGHNPLLEDLVSILTNEVVALPTATVACLDLLLTSWQEVGSETHGRVRFVFRGKDVGDAD